MKTLARAQRQKYGIDGPRVLRTDMRRIFKEEGIRVDYWDGPMKKIRGAYFNDHLGQTIMILRTLPADPCVFTMAHEFKHHLVDKNVGLVMCENTPASQMIEIGAEVFAAEFLFPEECFRTHMAQMGIGPLGCKAETLVRLKHETKTTLSYSGLVKLAVWLKFSAEGALPTSGWQKLEERIYGIPFYRRRISSRAGFRK
jgi:Zn-dependent peptidase ImmA (M78 family)